MSASPNGVTILSRKFKGTTSTNSTSLKRHEAAPDEWDVSDEEEEEHDAASSQAGPSEGGTTTSKAGGGGREAMEDVWGPTPGEASRITGFVPARKGPLDEWEAANRTTRNSAPILTHSRVLPTTSILPPSLRTFETGAPPPRILARPAQLERTGGVASAAVVKSKEQREREYEEARRRIFGEEGDQATSARGRGKGRQGVGRS